MLCSVDYIFLSFGITDSIVNFETIRGSLKRVNWQKQASLAQKTLYIFSSLVYDMLRKMITRSKNIFDLTIAGDRDCVAAVKRLHVLHFNEIIIFVL